MFYNKKKKRKERAKKKKINSSCLHFIFIYFWLICAVQNGFIQSQWNWPIEKIVDQFRDRRQVGFCWYGISSCVSLVKLYLNKLIDENISIQLFFFPDFLVFIYGQICRFFDWVKKTNQSPYVTVIFFCIVLF